MRLFLAIFGLLFLAVVGFFVYAINSTDEDDSFDSQPGEVEAGGEANDVLMQVGAGAKISAPQTEGTTLGAESQLALWDSEHAAFEIEQRFGQRFCNALQTGNAEAVESAFAESFSGEMPNSDDWEHVTHGPFSQSSRVTKAAERAEAEGIASVLMAQQSGMARVLSVSLKVAEILSEGEGRWKCILKLESRGLAEDERVMFAESEHSATFVFTDDKDLDSKSPITNWAVRTERRLTSESRVASEVGGLGLHLAIGAFDNWGTPEKNTSIIDIQSEMSVPKPVDSQIAVADFDNDGDADIIFGMETSRVLLENTGADFKDATAKRRLPTLLSPTMSAPPSLWLDIDNDGDLDLLSGESIFRNEGDEFKDISTTTGLDYPMAPSSISVCDYDADGILDLYVTYRGLDDKGSWITDNQDSRANQLWQGLGDGQFEDVTTRARVGGGTRGSTGAVWFFANDDHYPDLVITNDLYETILLLNNGDGTFDNATTAGWTDRPTGFTGGVTTGDINNDGKTDLYFSGLYSSVGQRVLKSVNVKEYRKDTHSRLLDLCSGSRLLTSTEAGDFENTTAPAGVGKVGWAWGACMLDLDSDGYLDLYATSGYRSAKPGRPGVDSSRWRRIATVPDLKEFPLPKIGPIDDELGEVWALSPEFSTKMNYNLGAYENNRLFMNQKDGRFLDVSMATSLAILSDSRAAIPADLNQDGAIDLVVLSAGGGVVRTFLNEMEQGNRITVRLVGDTSNRFGIGSRITVTTGDQTIVRDVFPVNGRLGSGSTQTHVGIGENTSIDKLTVRWPTGEVQTFENVRPNRGIEITEGKSEIRELATFADQESEK